MKYETLLGSPEKFIGHKEDAEILLWHDFLGPKALTQDEMQSMSERGQIPCGAVIIAMRRIIKEPKRWTWEDKKAGVLPEVGSTAQHKHSGIGIAEILVVKDGFIVVQYVSDNKILTFTNAMFLEYFNPIETPDEKAQREEDEFIYSLKSVEIHDGTVSSFFNQGARAAYRKLKGGE